MRSVHHGPPWYINCVGWARTKLIQTPPPMSIYLYEYQYYNMIGHIQFLHST